MPALEASHCNLQLHGQFVECASRSRARPGGQQVGRAEYSAVRSVAVLGVSESPELMQGTVKRGYRKEFPQVLIIQFRPVVRAKFSSSRFRLVQCARIAKISYHCSGLRFFVTSAFNAWPLQVSTYSLPSVA